MRRGANEIIVYMIKVGNKERRLGLHNGQMKAPKGSYQKYHYGVHMTSDLQSQSTCQDQREGWQVCLHPSFIFPVTDEGVWAERNWLSLGGT